MVLLDIAMPGAEGLDVLDALRRHRAWWQIPVVTLLLRETTLEQRGELHAAVADAFRLKQAGPDQILDEVRRWAAARV